MTPLGRLRFLIAIAAYPATLAAQEAGFELDPAGYVQQWLVTEPDIKPHYAGRTDSGEMPVPQLPEWRLVLPDTIALDASGPSSQTWRYHGCGDNIFMDFDRLVSEPSAVRLYAAVDLIAPENMAVEARLWSGRCVGAWLDNRSLAVPRTSPAGLTLPLRQGRNTFVALLQAAGLRALHLRLGLQLPDHRGRVRVAIPGHQALTADLLRAESWIRSLRLTAKGLVAAVPPPFPSEIENETGVVSWPPERSAIDLPADAVRRVRVRILLHGQQLERPFDVPAPPPVAETRPARGIEAHRRACIESMRGTRLSSSPYLIDGIIRRMLDEPPVFDAARLDETLRPIRQRIDCADFVLALALRFYRLDAGAEEDRRQIRTAALGFRHWQDEPGQDGMCFHSENHRLLFHGNQLLSGTLWPDEVFSNSGRTGREQARLGRERCLAWFEQIEPTGYEEFLSTTYAPITTAALMNLADFSDDEELSRRAARQVDCIYRMLAEHTFDGVVIGPQGRTSRRMLHPERLGTQSLLSYATPSVVEAPGPWTIFVASSPHYRPPGDLDPLLTAPVWKRYRQGYFLVSLKKTPDYMLSSFEIPASARDPSFRREMRPGGHGYQQHIWHATLGGECHVFTTHPGSSTDVADGRPGFWTGNGVFPRQTQEGGMLCQIFSIPDEDPIHFTHAHWPTEAFDTHKQDGNWIFGRKREGYVALWCSTKPEFHDSVLINRELRARGDRMAWVCVCSSKSESGTFEAFIRSCMQREPLFDSDRLILRLEGREALAWPSAGQRSAR